MVKLGMVFIVICFLTWTGSLCSGVSAQNANHKTSPHKAPLVESPMNHCRLSEQTESFMLGVAT